MSAGLLLRPPKPRRPVPAPDAASQLLLTVPETAALLRTTRKAVYALIERGLLPGVVRLGRRVLFDRETLIRFVRERCAPSVERR
jgi:excisionase family DNA binding protein